MTITYMDIGGGGATLGAIAAGLNPIWGIEKDKKIATVAYLNCGKHAVYVKDIRDLPDVFLGKSTATRLAPRKPSLCACLNRQ